MALPGRRFNVKANHRSEEEDGIERPPPCDICLVAEVCVEMCEQAWDYWFGKLYDRLSK